jgi:hypothetical protein
MCVTVFANKKQIKPASHNVLKAETTCGIPKSANTTEVPSEHANLEESNDFKLAKLYQLAQQLGLSEVSISLATTSTDCADDACSPETDSATAAPIALVNSGDDGDKIVKKYPEASLLGMPLELRLTVFGTLLKNSELGHSSCVSMHTSYGRDAEFQLYPEILAVSNKATKRTKRYYTDNNLYTYILASMTKSMAYPS